MHSRRRLVHKTQGREKVSRQEGGLRQSIGEEEREWHGMLVCTNTEAGLRTDPLCGALIHCTARYRNLSNVWSSLAHSVSDISPTDVVDALGVAWLADLARRLHLYKGKKASIKGHCTDSVSTSWAGGLWRNAQLESSECLQFPLWKLEHVTSYSS